VPFEKVGFCERSFLFFSNFVFFLAVLQETLQSFFARQAVELVQKAARRVSGQGDGLTRSQIVQDHPWIEDFIAHLDEELSDGISITLPDHFVDQVFRLFDANADGSVTKQEWVSKCNILTTEGTDQRIAALFTLIDEDGDGLLSEVGSSGLFVLFYF
jgi:hypothetical protein